MGAIFMLQPRSDLKSSQERPPLPTNSAEKEVFTTNILVYAEFQYQVALKLMHLMVTPPSYALRNPAESPPKDKSGCPKK